MIIDFETVLGNLLEVQIRTQILMRLMDILCSNLTLWHISGQLTLADRYVIHIRISPVDRKWSS